LIKRFVTLLLCIGVVSTARARVGVDHGKTEPGRRTHARADAIDRYVKAEMERQGVPGLALVIMKNGQPSHIKSYGLANLEHSVPVQPKSLFKTGATGMQLTAAAVMLLVEDGRMKLDDSIRDYLPEAPGSWQAITIRQMLNHTSGLPATPNGDFHTEYAEAEFLAILYKEELNFPAGTRWRFSYVDYVALGFVIKRVTGEPYADLLAKRIFTPLGMKTARPIDELAVIPNRVAGYELLDGKLFNAKWISQTANSTADGSLYLSPLDYVAWEAGMYKQTLLKPQTWAEIGRPALLASGNSYPYGFGWYLEQSAGQQVWRHTGSWQGFQTSIIRYLGDGLTIVVLANGESGNSSKVSRRVAAMLDKKYAQPPMLPMQDHEPQRTEQVKELLLQIAGGKVAYRDFTDFAELDFTEMIAAHQGIVAPLGPLRGMVLIGHSFLGDDKVYTYRCHYEKGSVEVIVGYASSGKIGNLEVSLVDES